MEANITKLAEQLVNLKVKEVQALLETLKQEYNIEPAALAAAPAGAVQESAEEEKKTVDIMIASFDAAKKMALIKEIRAITNEGLIESKKRLDQSSTEPIKKEVPKSEAEEVKKRLEKAGAVVKLQ